MRLLKTAAAAAALSFALFGNAFAHEYKAGDVEIGHPWTRATPPNAPVAGGYMTLSNEGSSEDRLVGGSSPIAGEVQVHEMTMSDGVMKMRRLNDGLTVPAGQTVTLKPGGYHIMLMDLKERVEEGTVVPLTLEFEKAGKVDVELAVESMGARTPSEHDGMDHGAMHGMDGHSMGAKSSDKPETAGQ